MDMEDNATAHAPETEEIKVTDKRRNIDWDEETTDAPDTAEAGWFTPEAGPSAEYVAEVEERARAAEERAQAAERLLTDVQARFEQARHKMQVEIDETRQRLNRTADEKVQRSKGAFIASMLPVSDTLQLAIKAAERDSSLDALLNGVRGTAQNFLNALLAAGVEPLVAIGQPFNPELHEAIDIVEVAPEHDGLVTAEYQRGYKMGERLLRPARVQVGRAA